MNDIKKYNLIVFDWDGTLYDSADHLSKSLKKAVMDLKQPMFDEMEYQSIAGLRIDDIIDALYADFPKNIRTNLKTRYRFHLLLNQKEVILYPHAKSVLMALKKEGYSLAVATGKSAEGLANDLHNIELSNFFDVTRTADKTASKPNPMMLEQIMEITATPHDKTLMVGDSIVDVQMAMNAGVDAVAIHENLQQCEFLRKHGAKAVISSLDELLNLLIPRC